MYHITYQPLGSYNKGPLASRIRPSVFDPGPWKRAFRRLYGPVNVGLGRLPTPRRKLVRGG